MRVARSPQVQNYISDATSAVRPWIEAGNVANISLIIMTKDMKPIERFVFDLGFTAPDTLATISEDLRERYLRAIILKISTTDSILRPLPSECTFAIYVTAKNETTLDAETKPQPWIVAAPQETQLADDRRADDGSHEARGDGATALDRAPLLHPLKQADLGLFALNVYAEEAVDRKELLRKNDDGGGGGGVPAAGGGRL